MSDDARSARQRTWMSLLEEKAKLPDMTVKEFCNRKDLSESSYWYYHRKLCVRSDKIHYETEAERNGPSVDFIEISDELISENKSCFIQINDRTRIQLNESMSDEFLYRILKAATNV